MLAFVEEEDDVVVDIDCDEATEVQVQGANLVQFVDPSRNLEKIDRTQTPN